MRFPPDEFGERRARNSPLFINSRSYWPTPANSWVTQPIAEQLSWAIYGRGGERVYLIRAGEK